MSGSQDGEKKYNIVNADTGAASGFLKPMARLTADDGTELRVVERVVRTCHGGMHPPMLTRTNYTDWELIMKVQL
jgi:hypothetical protein